jgi:hypothetical protein
MPICKGCQEIIKLIEMESGMRMPVDSKPISIVVLNPDGKGRTITGFMTHFATCPQADKFKRRKKGNHGFIKK